MKKILIALTLLVSFAFADGTAIYKTKCASCHGANGHQKALGKSAPIASMKAADAVKELEEYKAGTRNKYGMGASMKAMTSTLSDADIKAVAEYISTL